MLLNKAIEDNHSFWQLKYGEYTANAALEAGSHNVDVVIVGGGYTGLTTARELLKDNPSLQIMVLEGAEIGFGASGRNGGFNMTLFGLEPETTVLRWGKQRSIEAQQYMEKAVSYVRRLIEDNNLDSDYEHNGLWRVAYSDKQLKRLRKSFNLLQEISPSSYHFIEQSDIKNELNAPQIQGAIFEPDNGILDPCKHVRGLKRLAESKGAIIHENTLVTGIKQTTSGILVSTVNAEISCKKLVLATNAWSHKIQGLKKIKSRQRPVWTYQIVSDPLTENEWQELGWRNRMSIEDNRQLIHYLRITKCGRITIGGGNITAQFKKEITQWKNDKIWHDLENHFRWLFPTLKHKKIYYKWGGIVSVNIDLTPEVGFIGNDDIIYACGCIGHGVSLTQLNGRLIADLLQNKKTDLTDFWIVNRSAIPLPPGNLLPYLGVKGVSSILKVMDKLDEHSLNKHV